MPDETLAKPVIELALDQIKFKDSWEQAVATSLRFGKAIENAFKGVSDRGIAKSTLSMKEFFKATETTNEKAGRLLNRLKDINKAWNLKEKPLPKTFDFPSFGGMVKGAMGGIGAGIGTGIGLGSAGVGLAVAGAAAGGSTTLNTLLGSFKMLALTIGEKVQPVILKFADWIQALSDRISKVPGIGPGAGAIAAGLATLATTKNPLAALGVAGVTGVSLAASEVGDKREEDIERIRKDPNFLLKKIKQATAEEQKTGEPETFIRGMIREAERRNREGFKAEPTGLRAGIGGQAHFTGLADLRQEAQVAGFQGSLLDLSNEIKELNQNLKALGINSRVIIDQFDPRKKGQEPKTVTSPAS